MCVESPGTVCICLAVLGTVAEEMCANSNLWTIKNANIVYHKIHFLYSGNKIKNTKFVNILQGFKVSAIAHNLLCSQPLIQEFRKNILLVIC